MKKSMLLVGILISIFLTSMAYAKEGVYISGSVGAAVPEDSDVSDNYGYGINGTLESDTGIALNAAIGYDFNFMRVEGEIAYQKNDFDKLSVSYYGYNGQESISGDSYSLAGLANVYYDFHNSTRFTPFIGGGIGIAKVKVSSNEIWESDSDTVFAWQVGAGVAINIIENLDLDIKYRYFATEDPSFELATAEYASNNFYAGLRYTF